MSADSYKSYHERYNKIMEEFDTFMVNLYQQEKEHAKTSKDKIEVGDLVILRTSKSIHKEGRGIPNYHADIWEVTEIHSQSCVVTPLFHKSRRLPKVHISHVRKLPSYEILQFMPL